MSDKKQYVTYDVTKNITNVTINPAFISGIQSVYYRYVTEFYDKIEDIGKLTERFNDITINPKEGASQKFTPVEYEIYTLYTLIHLLKAHAKDQGLEQLNDIPVDDKQWKQITEEAKDKESITDALQSIADGISKLS
jgi:hypothetical protein